MAKKIDHAEREAEKHAKEKLFRMPNYLTTGAVDIVHGLVGDLRTRDVPPEPIPRHVRNGCRKKRFDPRRRKARNRMAKFSRRVNR